MKCQIRCPCILKTLGELEEKDQEAMQAKYQKILETA